MELQWGFLRNFAEEIEERKMDQNEFVVEIYLLGGRKVHKKLINRTFFYEGWVPDSYSNDRDENWMIGAKKWHHISFLGNLKSQSAHIFKLIS